MELLFWGCILGLQFCLLFELLCLWLDGDDDDDDNDGEFMPVPCL